jgi:hypothetical protein
MSRSDVLLIIESSILCRSPLRWALVAEGMIDIGSGGQTCVDYGALDVAVAFRGMGLPWEWWGK